MKDKAKPKEGRHGINLIFPHQLFENSPLIENREPVYLVEELLFFRQFLFHKQKIAFHRASMKFYESFLRSRKIEVTYIDSSSPLSDIRRLIASFKTADVKAVNYIDPTDNWLAKRIRLSAGEAGLKCIEHVSPQFLNDREALSAFFKPDKKKFFQTKFYVQQRKQRGILINGADEPIGGKWSFDTENRKKYPRSETPPPITYPAKNEFFDEAFAYVSENFAENPGELSENPLYPADFRSARKWLDAFLSGRFAKFGDYEDAIVAEESILNHSVLSPMLNTGLITPNEVIDSALEYSEKHDVPLNSAEGFIRQIIGWREFIRGVYECKGSEQRTRNFWGFERKIPPSFYDGTTGIEPLDRTIRKVLSTGYCHHIERLMVIGNFMVLCEFDPDEVYQWFMELFIDSYDWVMVPNVYGMSQYADGGLMSTKPYISGSNYIMKMSDYKKGSWQTVWDGLFWRFMNVHRDFFEKNPRTRMLVSSLDKMDVGRKSKLFSTAEDFLAELN